MRRRRQVVVAHEPVPCEHTVDVLRGLLGAAHERDTRTHDVGDDTGEQRIVGTAQHQGVDTGRPHRLEVLAGHALQLRTVGDAVLDELDEAWARPRGDPQVGAAAKESS